MNYRIWWLTKSEVLPNINNDRPFYYPVKDIEQGKFALKLLARYDLRNDLVSDNISGLETINNVDDIWQEYEDENDNNIWDIIDAEMEIL
jgi:hypothetical protein